ncbi:MAG: endonuclease/exonuclease/phosphatase family protein [Myxococcales bacterium]|nr:endonuclease/exonuclease/phosphatase family protein [Myxococcales bacterium]
MKLITWNVAGRKGKQPRQAEALLDCQPNIVALQEVTATTAPMWKSALEGAGFQYIDSGHLVGDRKNFNAVAIRRETGSLEAATEPWQGEYPERMLSARLQTRLLGPVDLHNAHIVPGSSRGFAKVKQLDEVYRRLGRPCATHRILCGDFNTPQLENADGSVLTFADHHAEDMREAWDQAERSIVLGLAEFDLADLFRRLHGYGVQEASWYPNHGEQPIGRRFDHVFASSSLGGRSCRYLHHLREAELKQDRLSDHSGLEAVFAPDHAQGLDEHS